MAEKTKIEVLSDKGKVVLFSNAELKGTSSKTKPRKRTYLESVATGMSKVQARVDAGVSRSVVKHWRETDPMFKELEDAATDAMLARHEAAAFEAGAARNAVQASNHKWYMKVTRPGDYSDTALDLKAVDEVLADAKSDRLEDIVPEVYQAISGKGN